MPKFIQKILVLTLALLLPAQLLSTSVFASTAPVQFTVPDTTLTVKGFAAPRAFVQIYDGNALIGTVVADRNGVFEKDFPAMSAGLHNLRMAYDDADGISSDPLTQTVNIRAQSDTAVEYFLPPTLRVQPVSLVEGELVTFTGSTIPNAIVEILLDGGTTILRPQSDARGRYSISVDTTGYYLGQHNVVASVSQGGLSSFETLKKPFIVLPVESGAGSGGSGQGNLTPPAITVDGPNGEIRTVNNPTLIRGVAPPNSQIIIYVDGEPIGSTFANADGNWFFNIPITSSQHEIRAITCYEADCSDFSNLIKIVYEGDLGACTSHRFWLSEYRFWDVREGNGIDLNITGIAGTPPYNIAIDWGDSVTERFNRDSAQSFNVHHIYERMGSFNGTITIADEDGCEYSRYFSVNVLDQTFDSRWLGLAGPAILLAILALRRRYRIRRKKLVLAR